MKLWLVEQACGVLDSARWRRTHGACSSLPSDTRVESALLPRPPTCNVVCDGAAAMMKLRLAEQQACGVLDSARRRDGLIERARLVPPSCTRVESACRRDHPPARISAATEPP